MSPILAYRVSPFGKKFRTVCTTDVSALIVKLGYVPDVVTPVEPVKTTVWSGAVLVIVYVPLEVIGEAPAILIPVPAVAPTLVTVPTLNIRLALKSLVEPLIVIVLVNGT
jgi:hypothetical protein